MTKRAENITSIRKAIMKKLNIKDSALSIRVTKLVNSLPLSIPREYVTYIIAKENKIPLRISEEKREKLNDYLMQITKIIPKHISTKKFDVLSPPKPDKKRKENLHKVIKVSIGNFILNKTNLPESRINEAKDMTELYFYLNIFENSIRFFVLEIMKKNYGDNWWILKAKQNVQKYVDKVKTKNEKGWLWKKEPDDLFYTTFGQLVEIIEQNWIDFKHVFANIDNLKWFINPIKDIRNPIAHNNIISKGKKKMLLLHIQEWFDYMNTLAI